MRPIKTVILGMVYYGLTTLFYDCKMLQDSNMGVLRLWHRWRISAVFRAVAGRPGDLSELVLFP